MGPAIYRSANEAQVLANSKCDERSLWHTCVLGNSDFESRNIGCVVVIRVISSNKAFCSPHVFTMETRMVCTTRWPLIK